jgi:hypothetical protein
VSKPHWENIHTGEEVSVVRYDCQGPRPEGMEVWDRSKGEGPADASWGWILDPDSGNALSIFHGDFIVTHDDGSVEVLHHVSFVTKYRERTAGPRKPK